MPPPALADRMQEPSARHQRHFPVPCWQSRPHPHCIRRASTKPRGGRRVLSLRSDQEITWVGGGAHDVCPILKRRCKSIEGGTAWWRKPDETVSHRVAVSGGANRWNPPGDRALGVKKLPYTPRSHGLSEDWNAAYAPYAQKSLLQEMAR